jgi:hypothetical protein
MDVEPSIQRQGEVSPRKVTFSKATDTIKPNMMPNAVH